MAGEAVITIIGNITDAPELRFTSGGVAVANLTIANNSRHFDKASGEWQDGNTVFMRCTVWREHAEHVADTLKRGDRVIAQGRLRQRRFQTAEGENRTVIEMDIDEIGPALRYATATITKATRSENTRAQAPAEDPWAPAELVGAGVGGGDEPTF